MKTGNIVGETMTKFLMASSCATTEELIEVCDFIARQLLNKEKFSNADTFLAAVRVFLKQVLKSRGQTEH